MSNGEAGDSSAVSGMSATAEACLKGSGFYTGSSYDGIINVEGCPVGCQRRSSREGLQYILLTGGMRWKGAFQEQSLLFDARTGVVMDNPEQVNIWLSQFGD